MEGPIDYWGQLSNIDVGKAFTDSLRAAQQRQAQQAEMVQAQQAQARLDAAQEAFIKNPSAENVRTLFMLDPKSREAIQAAHKASDAETQSINLKDQTAVHGYLSAGRPQDASRILQRRIDADKAAGRDTSDDQQMLDLINEDPAAARAASVYSLAGTVGPDKFAATFGNLGDADRANAKLPGEIAQNAAATQGAIATANKTIAETSQIAPNAEAERQSKAAQARRWQAQTANEAARLNLDVGRYQDDVAIRYAQLDQTANTLPAPAQALVNTAVLNSTSARSLSAKASSLADKLATASASGGVTAGVITALTGLSGDASAVTQLRRDYEQLRNQQAVKSLPPGPASDKDIQMALKGFPEPTASADTMVAFLRGVAKMQDLVAQDNDLQADWLVGNGGSLGPARNGGFFVGNRLVKPGERFSAVITERNREQAKAAAQARMAPK
jgi:hypothetical protein